MCFSLVWSGYDSIEKMLQIKESEQQLLTARLCPQEDAAVNQMWSYAQSDCSALNKLIITSLPHKSDCHDLSTFKKSHLGALERLRIIQWTKNADVMKKINKSVENVDKIWIKEPHCTENK